MEPTSNMFSAVKFKGITSYLWKFARIRCPIKNNSPLGARKKALPYLPARAEAFDFKFFQAEYNDRETAASFRRRNEWLT